MQKDNAHQLIHCLPEIRLKNYLSMFYLSSPTIISPHFLVSILEVVANLLYLHITTTRTAALVHRQSFLLFLSFFLFIPLFLSILSLHINLFGNLVL